MIFLSSNFLFVSPEEEFISYTWVARDELAAEGAATALTVDGVVAEVGAVEFTYTE